ncbi:tetratricopeptide repeat protein [Bacteroidales bacterium AH-315-I05]|nr:tetratricopeptide repeat protein [Bacteroidales bacterium AH-315-I05]
MKTRLFLFFISTFSHLLIGTWAFAQNQSAIDSLETLLKTAKADTNKVKLLYKLCYLYRRSDSNKATQYGKQGLALSEQLGFNYGIAASLTNIGEVYRIQSDYTKAMEYYKQALKIKEESGDKHGIALILHNMGIVYYYQGNYNKALELFLQSLKTKEELGNKDGIAISLNTIGAIYNSLNNPAKSIDYFQQALKIQQELGDKAGIASSLNNIATIHQAQGDLEIALDYLQQSVKMYEKLESKHGIALCLNNIGQLYSEQNKYDKAIDHYKQSLKIREKLGDKQGVTSCLNNIGALYSKLGLYEKAIESNESSLVIAKEIDAKRNIKNAYQNLSNIYSKQNNYKKAYEYFQLYAEINDSMFNEESTKQIAEMQTKYETEKKEKENELLKKENEKQAAIAAAESRRQRMVIYFVAAVALAVALIAFVMYRRFREKQIANLQLKRKNDAIERQKKIIEKEKQRSEDLLHNILPVETAAELKETGQATPRQYKKATVLFTDFKGFTMLAEKMTPVELVSELHFCFKKFDKIISNYPIEKIKTIGDAYMCAGGLPRTNNTNPVDLVLAGLEVQQFMQQWKEKKISKNEPFWEIRIGIHTGPVIAGIVGVKKFAYDIWGDTVNTASRMESSGEPGKVNISGDTYEWVKDFFDCTHRGKVQAKNKGKVDMYFVERIKPELSQNKEGVLPNEQFSRMC